MKCANPFSTQNMYQCNKIRIGNKTFLGTIKNKPLSQSLQKQTQEKDLKKNNLLNKNKKSSFFLNCPVSKIKPSSHNFLFLK